MRESRPNLNSKKSGHLGRWLSRVATRATFFSVLLSAGLFLGSCSNNNFGDHLSLQILPTDVIVGPGPLFTCLDYQNESTTASGTGPVILFPKVIVKWTDASNTLLISTIRVTISGFGIAQSPYVYNVTADEMGAMLGTTSFGPNTYSDSSVVGQPSNPISGLTINARAVTACGLIVPSIPLLNGTSTNSFRAQVKVDLIGTSLSPDYSSQAFVKQTVYGYADYYKY